MVAVSSGTAAKEGDETPNSTLLVFLRLLRLFRRCLPILIYFLVCAFNSMGGGSLFDLRGIPDYTSVAIQRPDVTIWCVSGCCCWVCAHLHRHACIPQEGSLLPGPYFIRCQVQRLPAFVMRLLPTWLLWWQLQKMKSPNLQPQALLSSGTSFPRQGRLPGPLKTCPLSIQLHVLYLIQGIFF